MSNHFEETSKLSECSSPEERRSLLAELYMRYRDRLRTMVDLRIDPRLRGRIDPSDVLQEAFIEISQRLDEYLKSASVTSLPLYFWFRKISGQKLVALHRHHIGAQCRDASRDVSLSQDGAPLTTTIALVESLISREAGPAEAALHKERRQLVQKALELMEPLDREVLSLRHFEFLTNSEVAQLLGITASAASRRYLRALDRLEGFLLNLSGGDAVS